MGTEEFISTKGNENNSIKIPEGSIPSIMDHDSGHNTGDYSFMHVDEFVAKHSLT